MVVTACDAKPSAGQMIENTVKAVRRNQTVDEAYYEALYSDMNSLYRLDQIELTDGKQSLGPLPRESVILLGTLGAVWLMIGIYAIGNHVKRKKSQRNADNP